MTFGEKLQKLRKEAGMSQEELAAGSMLGSSALSFTFTDTAQTAVHADMDRGGRAAAFDPAGRCPVPQAAALFCLFLIRNKMERPQQKTPPRARRFLFTAAKIPAHRRCVSAPPAGTAPGKGGTAPGTPY